MQRRLAIVLAAITVAVAAAGPGSATASRLPGLPPPSPGGIKDGG